ncbi:MAG: acylneuraminate cytidylyltransferase family protein [Candidatus Thermoplasmatota archaeon]|nr:acylneuraminate cytidylyltransferase family protein [Candidatus Thermoplasmatota archaeon]
MQNILPLTALVPMKDHSERVPSKNIRTFGNKPLFFHILQSLTDAKYIDQIIVNTDSKEIKSLIKKNFQKIIVIERPPQLLGDKIPMTPIIEYDLNHVTTDHFLQTHATNPLLKSSIIDNAIIKYHNGLQKGFDSAIGVNVYQTRFYDSNKKPLNHDPTIMVPSQDMPIIYEDNSNFYINSKNNFLAHNNRVGKNPLFIPVPKLQSIDIDDEEDFIIANAVFNFLKNEQISIEEK